MDRPIQILLAATAIGGLAFVCAPAAAQQCFPSCRPGFTCHQGQCVSLCNPPCADGHACTAAAMCEPRAMSGPGSTQASAPHLVNPEQEAERQRLRDIRKRFHFGAYLNAGYGSFFGLPRLESERGGEARVSLVGILIGGGVLIRQNPVHVLGYQVRAGVTVMPGTAEGSVTNPSGRFDGDGSGTAIQLDLEASLRIGPFAQRFPMYIELGGHLGALFIDVTLEPDSFSRSTAEPTDASGSLAVIGPAAAMGFVFGDHEQFDLSLRSLFSFELGDQDRGFRGWASFGWAFL